MTAFRQILDSKDKVPDHHIVLKPSAFQDTWVSKPTEDIALGLRRIADNHVQTARAEAAKYATMMHDDRLGQIEAYNDALMRWMIVAGTCDANDLHKHAPVFDGFEENVRLALTSQGIRYLWDAIDRFHIENTPLYPSVTDEEIAALGDRLQRTPLFPPSFPHEVEVQIRKLLGYVFHSIRDAEVEVTEAEEEREFIENQTDDDLDSTEVDDDLEVSNRLDTNDPLDVTHG